MQDLSDLSFLEVRRIKIPLALLSLPLLWILTHLFRKILFDTGSLEKESYLPFYTAIFASVIGVPLTLGLGGAEGWSKTKAVMIATGTCCVFAILLRARVFIPWPRIGLLLSALLPTTVLIQQVAVAWAAKFVP